MKKLILHIGAHKTGSSSIQYFLHKRRRELDQAGWEFVIIPGSLNLRQLFKRGTNANSELSLQPTVYKTLLKQLQDAKHNCVISAEDFFFLNDQKTISQLRSDFGKVFSEIRIILYLKRQDMMAISQKSQGAKTIR